MATNVLAGLVLTKPLIRNIEGADYLQIWVRREQRPMLVVTENGDSRSLPISCAVAEALIAWGICSGN